MQQDILQVNWQKTPFLLNIIFFSLFVITFSVQIKQTKERTGDIKPPIWSVTPNDDEEKKPSILNI